MVLVPLKFSLKYFRTALAISAHYLVQLKRGTYIHGNFRATPENREKHKSLAQRIFPIDGNSDRVLQPSAMKLLMFMCNDYNL